MTIAALSALFIATKIEEQPRKLRDTLSTLDYAKKLLKGYPDPDPVIGFGSIAYTSLKRDAINGERYIMKVLGFSVYQDTPYKYVIEYVKLLQGTNKLRQCAWNYVNDAHKSIAVVSFPPNYIAVTAIYMAASKVK